MLSTAATLQIMHQLPWAVEPTKPTTLRCLRHRYFSSSNSSTYFGTIRHKKNPTLKEVAKGSCDVSGITYFTCSFHLFLIKKYVTSLFTFQLDLVGILRPFHASDGVIAILTWVHDSDEPR